MTTGDPIQVLMHPILVDDFKAWLEARGLELAQMPSGEDDLPTYTVTPTDEALGL